MKIHNFFIKEKLAEKSEIEISDVELLHQWNRVLKFHVGEQVKLFDNSGSEFLCEIISLDKKSAKLTVLSFQSNVTGQLSNVRLFFSLIKKDKAEWLLQKCTELGVSAFQPIISERSENKGFNLDRAKKIIQEACEQSGRAILPEVSEPVSLENGLKQCVSQSSIAFDSSGSVFPKADGCQLKASSFFIGPEGGFTPNELEMFKQAGVKIYFLGKATLRAETAAVAATTILLLNF